MIHPPITPFQIAMCRGGLHWTMKEAASRLGVAMSTIARLERGGKVSWVTLERLRVALEAAGFSFPDPRTVVAPCGTEKVNIGQPGWQKGHSTGRWNKVAVEPGAEPQD